MKRLVFWFQTHPKVVLALTVAFFLVMTCCSFPIFNLGKDWSGHLPIVSLLIGVSVHCYLGSSMAALFPKARKRDMVLISTAIIVTGLLSRFLLEYGEVSNLYNFTPENTVVHLLLTISLTTLSWYTTTKRNI